MFCVHKDEQLLTFFNFSKLLQLCPKLGDFSSKAPPSKYQEKEGKRHIFWQIWLLKVPVGWWITLWCVFNIFLDH